MAEIFAEDVELQLEDSVLGKLLLIEDSGKRVATRCDGDLHNELEEFRNHVAAFLGKTSREDLLNTENRAYFNNRLLNTGDFFKLSPPIVDALVNSVNLRKQSLDTMAQSMADFILEIAFMGLEFLRGKYVTPGREAVTKEIAEKGLKEIEEKNVKGAISTFSDKVAKLYDETIGPIANLTKELTDLNARIGRFRGKVAKMREWMARQKTLGKSVPDDYIAECWRKSQDILQMEMEAMKRDHALTSKQVAAEALQKVKEKLGSLTAETGENLSQKWSRLLGPDGEGGAMIEEARKACQDKLNEIARIRAGNLLEFKNELGVFPEHIRTDLSALIARYEESIEKTKILDVFDNVWFDIQKNYTSQIWQNAMNQAQNEDDKQKKQLGTESWWDTLWSWWYKIRDLAYQLVVYVFAIFTGLVSVVISIVVTALGWIGAMAMRVFSAVAGFIESFNLFDGTTFLGEKYRTAGKDSASKFGVTAEFFSSAGQKKAIQDSMDRMDPNKLPDSTATSDKGTRQTIKTESASGLKSHAVQEQGALKRVIYEFVLGQCRSALQTNRISQIAPDFTRSQSTSAVGAVKYILERMAEYKKQFEFGNSGFFEFVKNMAWDSVDLKFSWPELANYMQLIGSQLTLLARIVGGALIFTVAGAPFVPMILGVAQGIDLVTAGGRVLVSIVCTMPCVNAFAYDLVAIHSLAFESLIEGNKTLPDPEFAGWKCQTSD